MNDFRTIVSIDPSPIKIGFKTPVLTIGSCFSDVIGQRLNELKFPVLINPFGTSYNPISIHRSIEYAVSNSTPPASTFLTSQGLHLNFDFHSVFAGLDRTETEKKINQAVSITHQFLKDAKWLMITYGTTWVYKRNDNSEIVANCHKRPAKEFTKFLLDTTTVIDAFKRLRETIQKTNPGIKFILTVSPVRHHKDTLELNSVSKSILRTACHHITQEFKDVDYFPSYEIMMDDLRDYRFYKSDMIHPSETAEQYIWSKFKTRYFDSSTVELTERFESVKKALDHKPFHPASVEHKAFLKQTLRRLEELSPHLDVSEEIATAQRLIG